MRKKEIPQKVAIARDMTYRLIKEKNMSIQSLAETLHTRPGVIRSLYLSVYRKETKEIYLPLIKLYCRTKWSSNKKNNKRKNKRKIK